MTTFILTVVLVALLMAAMAIGAIVSNKHLKGSCGGEGGAQCACDAQGIPRKCEQPRGEGNDQQHPKDVVPTSAFGRRRGGV